MKIELKQLRQIINEEMKSASHVQKMIQKIVQGVESATGTFRRLQDVLPDDVADEEIEEIEASFAQLSEKLVTLSKRSA